MKTSKRIISFVLCVLMVASCFFCTGKLPELEAHADVTLGGITQKRVVSNHEALYRSYQKRFFGGEETNWPTDFVIPGLGDSDDYTPQGMTYWKAKEWILISAYDASGQNRNSVIYALDVVSTNLVAVFMVQNADGSVNTSHGGGIAASEYNFYYADDASKISYVPLSEMDVAPNTTKTIKLKDSIDLKNELNGVATSYCCYDEGVLWTGNFYFDGDSRYSKAFTSDYKQTLMGYKLAGNSSAEEWYYLKNGYNLVKLNSDSPTNNITSGAVTYKTFNVGGANAEIHGTITTTTAISEITPTFASVSLTEGKKYKIEFIADNNLSDMYMFAPNGGGHCNVKQSQASKITNLGNGKYHYQMIFTAGLKPAGADSSWPTTQPTSGAYTGTYTIRFDQDSIPAGGRTFNITDISITEYAEASGFIPNSMYEGVGCQGNPTYVILLNMDKIQYAMVDKGKIYISRSWSRSESTNHSRDLVIGDIDLTNPGDTSTTINGRTRPVHVIKYSNCTHFGGDKSNSGHDLSKMLYMGEALCVINDYLYMFGEGAGYTYRAKEDNKCPEPIDVIWKIDQYAIQGLQRPHEDVSSVAYEKVYSLSDIKNAEDEYIIVYKSALKDPVTQDNILYLLDSYGGYGDTKLPKKAAAGNVDAAKTGDSRGIVGYEIRDYSVTVDPETGKENLILSAEDDANKSLHWQFESTSSASLKLKNRDLYFAKNPYLYIGDSLLAMTTTASSTMKIKDWGNTNFTIYGNGQDYSLWCNDGSVPASVSAYTNFYSNHNTSGFVPNYHGLEEQAGTFHVTNSNQPTLPTGDQQMLQIYKRVTDPYTSSYETQVYTDLQAKLTADGTYDIVLETYATNNLQYQRVEKARPTDFIFVLDTSGTLRSDDKKDVTSYYTESGWTNLAIASLTGNTDKPDDPQIHGYKLRDNEDIYYKTTKDGVYHPVYAAVRTTDLHKVWGVSHNCTQHYWAYYISKTDGLYYMMYPDSVSTTGITYETLKSYVDNDINYSASVKNNSEGSRDDTVVYKGPHYNLKTDYRIAGVKNAVDSLTYKIADHANTYGYDHRIAICTFGSNANFDSRYPWTGTNLYTNNGSAISYPNITAANYQNAFYSVSQFGTVRNVINNITALGHTFPSYGLEMASKIIDNQKTLGNTYDVNGNRSAVVIVITDGTPGGDESAYYNIDTAKSIANDTLANGAYSLKRNGAYVYSVLLGNDSTYGSSFSPQDFAKYLSSEYTGSKSLTDPGPHNTKEGVNYYLPFPVGSAFNLDNVINQVFSEVVANSNNATASLTSAAVLREHLTDAFDTSKATVTYQTAQSKYDGIGRLYFEKPVTASGVTGKITNTNEIEITGFDYSANNVSEYNSKKNLGKKLIVTISGVVADRNQILSNALINDPDYTALYENDARKTAGQPLKEFPSYHFSIPEYTYVLDYDLPMLDTDINGTLCSVDTAPVKQENYSPELNTKAIGVKFTNSNQDMYYSLNSQEGSAEDNSRAYVLIKRDNGNYDWFRLNIIPASTVYFEDNKTLTAEGTESYVGWTQSGSYVGKEQTAVREGDVFGNDPLYSGSSDTFSLGTNLNVTVSSTAQRSQTKTFSFKGTGFDLVSACGTNTGIQTVVVKDANDEIKKIYVVDTFYNDSTYGTIYQAPIVHFEEDPKDANSDGSRNEYTVEVTAAYYSFAGALKPQNVSTNALGETGADAYSAPADTAVTDEFFAAIGMDELIGQDVELVWMDENSVLNGGEGATETIVSTQSGTTTTTPAPATSLVNYIDGFRIYNPLTVTEANDNYPANEKNATYYNLINNLGSGAMTSSSSSLFAYIEGKAGSFSFSDYSGLKGKGPKNEIYLNSNASNGIGFNLNVTGTVSAKLSMRAVSGSPRVKINGTEFTVTNTSEQYFDITKAVKDQSTVTISVSSTGSKDLVAIGNLRLNNASVAALASEDLANVARMMTMAATPVTYDPSKVYTPDPTFVDAPADNPAIDPEGRIPTLEEYIAIHGSGNSDNNDHSGADSFADKLVAIVEKLIDFIKKVIALVVKTVTSLV